MRSKKRGRYYKNIEAVDDGQVSRAIGTGVRLRPEEANQRGEGDKREEKRGKERRSNGW